MFTEPGQCGIMQTVDKLYLESALLLMHELDNYL